MRLCAIWLTLMCGRVFADGPLWEPPASFPAILRDVASRLPRGTDARDADLITYTHEATHFLSRWREGHHGIYILDGRRHFIPTPPLTTAQVLGSVPAHKRGAIYDTYLRQGQTEYWITQPLMILDEWNAYTHGSIARRQMSLAPRQETDIHCHTFAGYAAVLYRLAKDCPGYDSTELQRYCRWNLDRCKATIPEVIWDQSFD